MRTKSVIPCALLLALLGTRQARAQDYLRGRESPDVPSATQAPLLPEKPTPIALPPVTGPDSYITYNQPCCYPTVGGDGPITWELFIRTGPRMPVSGSFLNHFMVDGWMVQGGGRTLLYNVDRDAAWTVEIGLSHSINQGRNNMWLQLPPKKNQPNPLGTPPFITLPGDIDTVDLYQQTLANLGLAGRMVPGRRGIRTGKEMAGRGGCRRPLGRREHQLPQLQPVYRVQFHATSTWASSTAAATLPADITRPCTATLNVPATAAPSSAASGRSGASPPPASW